MTTRYPREQMHRIAYTKLDASRVLEGLRGAAAGPADAPGADLEGETFAIVTDGGPALTYDFRSRDRLIVSENGGAAVEAGYGSAALGDVVLYSHVVSGTARGYHVVVDPRTRLATVFEFWFNGFDDNREVQRQVWFGYLDTRGEAPPAARHAPTNRLEGAGFHWRQDNGIETLEFYPSTIYSNFVELTRFGGELSFCAPSDYVRIDDETYVYSRVECEFSGVMTLYLLDANRAGQAGVRIGFDAADELEYRMFRGRGEWLGQIAKFEPFGEAGDAPYAGEKGARRVYRPMRSGWTMTADEVARATRGAASVFDGPNAMAGNKLPPTAYLAGRSMTLTFDNGTAIEYRFDDAGTLRWRRPGAGAWQTERYEAWESAPDLVMFGHLLTGAQQHDCYKLVADFSQGLVTCIHGTIGTPYIANESAAETWFGVIETDGVTPPRYRRHKFTDELVGRAITWNYSPGLTSMHLYSTPHSLSWIIFGQDGAGGMEWSGPASYVKIRDGIYLAYWLEEACNGTLGTILINLHTMHDCGIGYHCEKDGIRLNAMGAHARHAGRFDIAKFYEIST